MTTTPSFAEWLSAMMEERGLTRADVARGTHIPPPSLTSYLTMGQLPREETCRKLAAFFHVPDKLVLDLAGHTEARAAGREVDGPEWLRRAMTPLTPIEQEAVRRTVETMSRGFLRARGGHQPDQPQPSSTQ